VEPLTVQAVDVGREAAEPTIGVTKDGTAFYAAATFDAGGGTLARTEIIRSADGGITWESVQPDAVPRSNPPTTLDPYVYVEEDTGRVFSIDLTLACSYLTFSDDKGDSWTTNPAACGQFVNDHQTFFSGPPPEGMSTVGGFPEILYYCFNRVADASCSRSLDGGLTFSPTGQPAFLGEDEEAGGFCGGLHGHIATDKDGRLFVPKGHCSRPWIGISEDSGFSWDRVLIAPKHETAGPHLSVAADSAGNLYFVWWSREHHLPYLSVSKDHGKSWSTPRLIAPPGVHEVNFPVIAAGDKGRIVVQFPGTTVDDPEDATRPWNSYYVVSTNALSRNPLFVSTTANDPADPIHRGVCSGRCRGMFDFLDVIVSPHDGDFWGATVDTCTEESMCNKIATGQPTAMLGLAVRQLSGPSLVKKK
jgi:hypothetical protein